MLLSLLSYAQEPWASLGLKGSVTCPKTFSSALLTPVQGEFNQYSGICPTGVNQSHWSEHKVRIVGPSTCKGPSAQDWARAGRHTCSTVVYAILKVWMVLRYTKDVRTIVYSAQLYTRQVHFNMYLAAIYSREKQGLVYDLCVYTTDLLHECILSRFYAQWISCVCSQAECTHLS